VTLDLWDRTPHAWQFFGEAIPESREALRRAVAFLARHLRR
jgi:acetyl esterase/lipase